MIDIKDRKRAIVFTVALVVTVTVAIIVALEFTDGGMLGVFAALIGAIALAPLVGWGFLWVWKMTTPGRVERTGQVHAGEVRCPKCGSLQTDRISRFRDDGQEFFLWKCFQCDAEWV